MTKPRFSVKWYADGKTNERFFSDGESAVDYANLIANTNAIRIKLYKDGKRW